MARVENDVKLEYPWDKQVEYDKISLTDTAQKYVSRTKNKGVNAYQKLTPWLVLSSIFPCLRWISTYNVKAFLINDIVAGLSVGSMLVPQSMSYARLAGLPVQYGLYGGFLPVMAYSIFGTSPHLGVGPVAVTSLLLGNGLPGTVDGYKAAKISNPNNLKPKQVPFQEEYNLHATQLAFLVAVLYTGIGVLRLGFLTRFMSRSVMSGFITGAAILIGLSQVKYLLGIKTPQSSTVQGNITYIHENIGGFSWKELIMGGTFLLFLIALKFAPRLYNNFKYIRPFGPLLVLIMGLCAVYIGHVDKKGIKITGAIPAGLPKPTIDEWLPMPAASDLMPLAAIVCLVDLIESTSIARALGNREGYTLPWNQEITGLGIANFFGAAFHGYTTTGSFSRSAVNYESGAKTPLAGFITSWVIGFTLLFLTPLFEHLPSNVLGAIIIAATMSLYEFDRAWSLWHLNKLDFLCWITCWIVTMFAGVEIGVGVAVGLSLAIVIAETAFPHTARLGRIPQTTVYRNVKQYPEAERIPGMLIWRIDTAIYFANSIHLNERLRKYLAKTVDEDDGTGTNVDYVIVDLSPVTHIDATGLYWLDDVLTRLRKEGRQLVFANPNARVISALESLGFMEKLGRQWVFVRVHDAVQGCQADQVLRAAGRKEQEMVKIDPEIGRDSSLTGSNDTNGNATHSKMNLLPWLKGGHKDTHADHVQ